MQCRYQVIVVGGGHAGVEAAAAAARMGASTLLLTQKIDQIGEMSCNPAIGGIGKGHIVKEVDALDGIMAKAADASGIQFRVLNSSKGHAVRATRAQSDKKKYKSAVLVQLNQHVNLTLFQQEVVDFIIEEGEVKGVKTALGVVFYSDTVILTAGTFLSGCIHVGEKRQAGGRSGDQASNALVDSLQRLPVKIGRLKTGTPPRIDRRTVDLSILDRQEGHSPLPLFSFDPQTHAPCVQQPCYIAHTNPKVHQIIAQSMHLSSMYNGHIQGKGPRYCPSVENKIERFAHQLKHQVFIEPESEDSIELYPNGLSTSLPFEVQRAYIRAMEGFENAVITRPGYAIEYTYFDPRGLTPWLQVKGVDGLYFAGQINGTTGYEEAAGQGLVAGINAALHVLGRLPWYPKRTESYIGVMLDDLVTHGVEEPYRMFTSRAEYRLSLREDNADLRLTPQGYKLGVVTEERWRYFSKKRALLEKQRKIFEEEIIHPNRVYGTALREAGISFSSSERLSVLVKQPNMTVEKLGFICPSWVLDSSCAAQVMIDCRYEGYIERQRRQVAQQKKRLEVKIPSCFDYQSISGLSSELVEKLLLVKPHTVSQASRIEGMTPAAISLLLIFIDKKTKKARGVGA